MKEFITLLLIIGITIPCKSQENLTNRNNAIRISGGKFFADLGDVKSFYFSTSYFKYIKNWAIGGQIGFRYGAQGSYSNYSDYPSNLLGRSDHFQTTYAFDKSLFLSTEFGDIKPEFKEERFFQTYFHLMIERKFKILNRFYASLAVGPSTEYADIIFPAQQQPAKVSGFYGKDIEVYIYDYLLHRYFAFGWVFQGRFKYQIANIAVGPGFEFSDYPNGGRIITGFIEASFNF